MLSFRLMHVLKFQTMNNSLFIKINGNNIIELIGYFMFSVDFEELKLCSMKAPLVEKFDYKQDRSLAQANVASRFHKSACLRLAFEILTF